MTKYAVQGNNEEHSAKAKVNAVSISTKHCIEICNYLRKKKLQKAKELLQLAIEKKKPIPFKRFTGDVGHRKGDLTSGRYIVKACNEVLKMLNTVEANAQFKGLNTSSLVISHLCANKASTPWRYGRQTRRKGKRTHLEVVVEEKAAAKKQTPKVKKELPKEAPKQEVKEQPKVEKKETPAPKKQEPKPEIKKEVPKEPVQQEKSVEQKPAPNPKPAEVKKWSKEILLNKK